MKSPYLISRHLRLAKLEASYGDRRLSMLPRDKPDPMCVAKNHLGMRLMEKNGCLFLDGVPTNLNRIMWATNAQRKAMALPQVDSNPMWRV